MDSQEDEERPNWIWPTVSREAAVCVAAAYQTILQGLCGPECADTGSFLTRRVYALVPKMTDHKHARTIVAQAELYGALFEVLGDNAARDIEARCREGFVDDPEDLLKRAGPWRN